MPTTFSKPVSHEISPIRLIYEEPKSFIAQTDQARSVKPKEIKVKLCQDPMDPKSLLEQHLRLIVNGCVSWESTSEVRAL
jgi:hypothetical protein